MNRLLRSALLFLIPSAIAFAQPSIVTNSPLPTGVVSQAYPEFTFLAEGFGPFLWSAPNGLPEGLELSPSGVLSGTPVQASAATNYLIRVTDAAGLPAQEQFSLKINTRVQITTASLPPGRNGVPYSATLAATGGEPGSYTWTLVETPLPPGLELNTLTGAITGTPAPTSGGTYFITLTATDNANPPQISPFRNYVLIIDPLTITSPLVLPHGVQAIPYEFQLTTSGGEGPYFFWTLDEGGTGLPEGFRLTSDGLVAGTTVLAGTFTFRATVMDFGYPEPQSQTADFTLIINPTLIIPTQSLPNGVVGTPYTGVSIAATGGQPPLTWTLAAGAGSPPPGLTLNANGTVTGIPTTPGSYSFGAIATDSGIGGASQTRTQLIPINITVPPLQIATPSPLTPNAIQGIVYSKTLAATGGAPPYSWSTLTAPLPPGMSLSNTGVLSGAPTSAGPFSFTVRVTDTNSNFDDQLFNLTVDPPLSFTTNPTLPAGTVGVGYSQQISAANGAQPYVNWTVVAGTLPAGLTLNSSTGIISGNPAVAGTANFTVQVQDSGTPQQTAQRAFSLLINPPALTITTTTLPAGTQNAAYSQTLTATGGVAPLTWNVTTGALPTGITLAPGTGILSGTPTAIGTFNFTVQVSDSQGTPATDTQALTLVINPPTLTITTTTLPAGTQNAAYSQTLTATGGVAPLTWNVTTGALPAGITLAPGTGILSGTPTAIGTFNFTVEVRDAQSEPNVDSQALTLVINPPTLTITTTTLPAGTQNAAYTQTLAATGGVAPLTWSVTTGALPAGITLASGTGILSGTPTAIGTFNFTVQVSDSQGTPATDTQALTLVINPPTLTISTTTLPAGTQNAAYTQTLVATGGTPPYVNWTVTTGALPAGITLAPGTGILSGTPTAIGTFNFTVQVSDSQGTPATDTQALTLVINPPTLTISTTTLPAGVINTAYSQTLQATGGTPPYVNWTVTTGALPAGITLAPGTGILSGTPTATGTFNFTVQVSDSQGTPATDTQALTLVINPPTLTISTTTLPAGVINTAYSQTLQATGGTPPYVNWTVTTGSLPAGITLAPGTGILSGTPTATGTFNFTVQVSDSQQGTPATDTQALTLVINSPTLTISTTTLPAGVINTAYSQTLQATGGTPPYVNWTVTTGALPAGITLAPATGILSGTPTATGTFNFTVQVSDSQGTPATDTQALTLVINPPTLTISTTTLPAGVINTAYSQTLQATGGTPPYVNWTVTVGALPAGITLAPGTGILSGTPTAIGTFNFTVQVSDSQGTPATDTQALTLVINSPTLTITTTTLPAGTQNVAYTQTLAATGGTPPYVNWTITTGSLPAGITLAPGTGILSGTPTATGTFNFTVQVSDSQQGTPATDTQALTLVINSPTLTISTTTLPAGVINTAYSQTLQATGGTPPYVNWTVTTGALPAGITLARGTGILSGTPTATGTFNLTVQVSDSQQGTPATDTQALTLVINSPTLTITTTTLPAGTQNVAYTQTLAATGGTPPYVNWTITTGALPAGITLAPATGILSGMPTATGTFNLTVQVSDSEGTPATDTQALTLVINPPTLTISTTTLPAGVINTAYSQTVQATGGTPPYVNWTVTTGALPAGITLAPSTGILSGTPTATGTFNFTVQVSDSQQGTPATDTQVLTLVINPPELTIVPATLPAAIQNAAYSQQLTATGGTTPLTWSISAGTLPSGVTLNPTSGLLSGAPTATGTFDFTVQVQDSGTPAQSDTEPFRLVVGAQLTITTLTLPGGAVGQSYSQTFAATGGTGSLTWTLTVGTLPAGLTLNASAGSISGTPTAAGNLTFTLQVRDSRTPAAQTAIREFSLEIEPAELQISTSSPLPAGVTGTQYSQTFAATGGNGTFTGWRVSAGSLPAGLTLNSSTGLLSGTPTVTGASNFTVYVEDTDSPRQTATKQFALTVTAGTLTITNSSVPAGTLGTAYAQQLNASGGSQPYANWTVTTGALPPGITLNAGTGVLSGTPTQTGSFNFTVRVGDSSTPQATATRALTLVVNPAPLVITTSNPATSGNVDLQYSQPLAARGGTPPYVNWSLVAGAGSLPNGLGLNAATGVISGAPTIAGTYTFTVQVSDSAQTPVIDTQEFRIDILDSDFRITTPDPLTTGNVALSYSETLTAAGDGTPNNWIVVSGALPAGLTLNPSSGTISGTPTTAGNYDFTVRVSNGGSNGSAELAFKAFRLTILPGNFTITDTPLPDGVINASYNQTFAATGGTLPHVNWTITSGVLPTGLTLNGFTGQLTGIPTQTGSFGFTVQVQDSTATPQTALRQFNLIIAPEGLEITTNSPLPRATVGTAYSVMFNAAGGTPPRSNWQAVETPLPPGLTLNPTTGVLSGVPTQAGSYNITIQVEDNAMQFAAKTFALTISAPVPLSITTSSLPNGTVGVAGYSQTLAATGGRAPYSNWTVTQGALPAGLSLNSATGVISGAPTTVGEFTFTVRVSDSATQPQTASRPLTIIVVPAPLVITTLSPLLTGTVNQPYDDFTFVATGGTRPYIWGVTTGSLPPGLTLNSSTGVLAGTPTQSGAFNFEVMVTASNDVSNTKSFSLTINAIPLVITTESPLTSGVVGANYSQQFAATGGTGALTWARASGTLPPGLTLNSAGLLTGAPTQAGTFNFVVSTTDTQSVSSSKPFALTIAPPALTITSASPLPPAEVVTPYTFTFAAAGGVPPVTWALATGSNPLPAGLTLNPTTGVLSGTPAMPGSYTFTIQASDSAAAAARASVTKVFAIEVGIRPLVITTATPLSGGTFNTPYSLAFTATGGAPPYQWQTVSGTLPQGVGMSAAGLLSGTPSQSGSFTFVVRVRDSLQNQVDGTFVLPVDPGSPIITTTALPSSQALQVYSYQLTAIGGTPPYIWSLAEGSMPNGFTFNGSGQIQGSAGDAVTASFTARVTDRAGRSSTKPFTLVIGPRQDNIDARLEIATTSLSDGEVGKIYGMQFAARNGSPPYRWSFTGLPAGIEGSPNGDILGTPERAGSYVVQVSVTDDGRKQATATLTLVIKQAIVSIVTEQAPEARVGDTYSASFNAVGGLPPYAFSITGGSLPPGVSLSSNGVLSGTPSQAGTFEFTLQAMDVRQERGTKSFGLLVRPPPIVITTSSLGNGTVGDAFTATIVATGGVPPYQWSATGLPEGLGIDAATGVISGTPVRNGSFNVDVTVTDQERQTTNRSYPVQVTTVLIISTATVGNMIVDVPISTSLAANGGRQPYSWTLASGSLPPGVSLNPSGAISGAPTAQGEFNFTVQVADANQITTSKAFSTRVVQPLLISTQTVPSAPFGTAYSTTLEVTGGVAPYIWSVQSGTLPPGIQLGSNGVISGTPTTAGTFNFTAQAADASVPAFTTQRGFSIQVTLPQVSGVTINLPSNPQPAQQPQITLQITDPYPVDMTGALTLTFAPNAANNADDPAIQFSTGGRSVTFTIPAGQTQAVFPGGNLGVQTGTTAGTITITTALNAAGSPVNCNCPLTQTIVIPRVAPVITALRVTRTATGFNVLITGYSTSREITQGVFRFAGTSSLQTTELTVPLTATFNTWFQGADSAAFGGQFSLTIPFTIQGDTSTVNSVTVTLTNGTGSSQPSTASF